MGKQVSSAFGANSLAPIGDRHSALKVVHECFGGYLTVAAIQGLLGVFLMRGLLRDALVLAAIAVAFKKWQSRIAAIGPLALGLVMAVSTVASVLGVPRMGGRNLILAAIVVYMGIRATQAAFALRRFPPDDGIKAAPEPVPPSTATTKAPSSAVVPARTSVMAAARVPKRETPLNSRYPQGHWIYDSL
jgi:hypothetical protein